MRWGVWQGTDGHIQGGKRTKNSFGLPSLVWHWGSTCWASTCKSSQQKLKAPVMGWINLLWFDCLEVGCQRLGFVALGSLPASGEKWASPEAIHLLPDSMAGWIALWRGWTLSPLAKRALSTSYIFLLKVYGQGWRWILPVGMEGAALGTWCKAAPKTGGNQHFRSCSPCSVSLRNILTGAGGFLAVTVTSGINLCSCISHVWAQDKTCWSWTASK